MSITTQEVIRSITLVELEAREDEARGLLIGAESRRAAADQYFLGKGLLQSTLDELREKAMKGINDMDHEIDNL